MNLADYARDYTTSQLIAAANYKQAIKNIDKKLKKTPNDPQTLSLKANILLLTGDLAESYAICKRLIAQQPPLLDYLSLELSYYNLCELCRLDGAFQDQDLETLWQNAIKAQRNSNEKSQLARKWASQSILYGQWQQVVKASLVLQKSSNDAIQSQRSFWFWQTTARYLASQEPGSGRIKGVHRDLVLRMLEKAVGDAYSAPESLEQLPPSIGTPQELKLVVEILSREHQHRDIVTMLNAPTFKRIAGNDYTFDFEKYRSLLKLDNDTNTRQWAKAALESAYQSGKDWFLDDWRVWSSLMKTARASDTLDSDYAENEAINSALRTGEHLTKEHARSKRPLRAQQLASLDIHWRGLHHDPLTNAADAEEPSAEKLRVCQTYFDRYFDQLFVVEDLEEKISTLKANELRLFRSHMVSHAKLKAQDSGIHKSNEIRWLTAETNILRIDYELLHRGIKERKSNQQLDWVAIIRKFIHTSLRLYSISRTHTSQLAEADVKSGDSSCMLAIQALILLHSEFQIALALINAACLLDVLLTNSLNNFEARTKQVKALTDLGLPSCAWQSFKALGVKEVLNDSLSALVFTRISVLSPQQSVMFDARTEMEKPLHFYKKSLSEIPKHQELALECRNYAQVIHFEDLAHRIEDSPTRWMLGLERRRVSRLRGLQYDSVDNIFEPMKRPKQLDLSSLSRKSREYAESHLGHDGFEPYLSYLGYIDSISQLVNGFADPQIGRLIAESLSNPQLRESLLSSRALKTVESESILPLAAVVALIQTITQMPTDFQNLLMNLKTVAKNMQYIWNENDANYWSAHYQQHIIPLGAFYNACYNSLEILHLCHKAADRVLVLVKSKTPQDAVKARQQCTDEARWIQETSKTRVDSIYGIVKQAQAQLPSKHRAVENFFNSAVEKGSSSLDGLVLEILGTANATEILWSYIEIARLNLDGVLKFKVK